MGYLVQQQAPPVMLDYKMINVSFVAHQREKGGEATASSSCSAAVPPKAQTARSPPGKIRLCRAKCRRPVSQRFELLRVAGRRAKFRPRRAKFREAIKGEGLLLVARGLENPWTTCRGCTGSWWCLGMSSRCSTTRAASSATCTSRLWQWSLARILESG